MASPASTLFHQPFRFAQGLVLPARALRLIWGSAAVGSRALLVGLLSGLLLLGLLVGVILGTGPLLELAWLRPEGLLAILWWAAALLLGALLFLTGATALPPLLLGPLLDSLSAAVEKQLGLPPPPEGDLGAVIRETARGTTKALLRIVLLLLGHGLLLLLWLIPGAGPGLWSLLSSLWTLFWLACEYLDISANRHGKSLREVVRLVLAHPGACLGFALSAYFLLWIPLLNLALVPLAVVGATILYAELQRSDEAHAGQEAALPASNLKG